MEKFCAFCYLPAEKLMQCGKCNKRKFCSRECQLQDWKTGHKIYCGKAGEIGVDFEVRDCDKGLGIFALRPFEKNEKVMMERPLFKFKSDIRCLPDERDIPEQGAKEAVIALMPHGGSYFEKLLRNGMSCTSTSEKQGEYTGLFVNMSRINHDCIGNTDHQYLPHRKVKILVASRCIVQGEDITFLYIIQHMSERRHRLKADYEFSCNCLACTSPEINAKLLKIAELDSSILELGSMGKGEQALYKGKALLALYDELGMSSYRYHCTLYDMFQIAITKRKHVNDGRGYIRKAYQHVLAYTDDEANETVQKMKRLAASPSSHRNYGVLG
jgi:hypothetical protein